MTKFDLVKNGYDKLQVDAFIDKLTIKYEEKLSEQKDKLYTLKNEVSLLKDRVDAYTEKDKQISKALIYAVENAEKIENNATNLFDVEVKRIKLLYAEWQELVLEMLDNSQNPALKRKINAFNKDLVELIENNQSTSQNKSIKSNLKKNSDGYIKNILNQMDYVVNKKDTKAIQKQTLDKMSASYAKESARVRNVKQKNMHIPSKMEEYLKSDEEVQTAYSKNIVRSKYRSRGGNTLVYEPNETGFDIQEALNIKEDLAVVMQGFDFFDEIEANNKKKKK